MPLRNWAFRINFNNKLGRSNGGFRLAMTEAQSCSEQLPMKDRLITAKEEILCLLRSSFNRPSQETCQLSLLMIINLPAQNNANSTLPFETKGRPVVLIGANGSGKSRMGYFIEQINIAQYNGIDNKIVRISAHRALKMPLNATLLNVAQADMALRQGWVGLVKQERVGG